MSDQLERVLLWAPPMALLVAAAVTDVRARRIPNWMTLSLATTGVAVALARGGGSAGLASLGGLAVALGVMLVPYAAGWMGAGDVKLAAAAGAWLGPLGAVWLVLGASLAGGVLAVVGYLASTAPERRRVRDNLTALALSATAGRAERLRPTSVSRGVPYGVAIAAAAVVLMVMQARG